MINSYINNSGKKIIIADMPGRYLLNSYSHYSARLKLVKDRFKGDEKVPAYYKNLQIQVQSLWAEIKKRNLLQEPTWQGGLIYG